MVNYRSIFDTDAKLDIIEHVNQDHLEEILIILKEYYPHLNIEQAQNTIDILKDIENIEASWGALENTQAKTIRHYLRNDKQLSGKQNHLKGYWRIDK